jgi:cytoskeletal protein RodZ
MSRRRKRNFFRRPEFWVLFLLALVLGVGWWVIASRPSTPDKASSVPSTTASTAATSSGSASLPTSGVAGESPDAANLKDAVYRFEEAYFLPQGDERTSRLLAICTLDGFRSLKRSSTDASAAEKSMKDMSFTVNRKADNIITPEPFGPDAVSVYSQIWIVSSRGKEVVNTFRVSHMTSWVKISGVWKLGFFDYGAVAYDFPQGA